LLQKAETMNGTKVISHYFENVEIGTLRKINDLIKQQEKTGVTVLGSTLGENAFILVSVTDDLVKKGLAANQMIDEISPLIQGSGGGRPNMAQAGSKETANVRDAVNKAKEIIATKLKSL
jgi:alanyl-tRNA synthetase